jgi:AraC-like DNA-binding protein
MKEQVESVQLPGPSFERHFSVKEVAQLWHMSVDTVRRLFENEDGVVRYGHAEGLHRRRYVSISIPQSVVEHVHRRLTRVKPGKPN